MRETERDGKGKREREKRDKETLRKPRVEETLMGAETGGRPSNRVWGARLPQLPENSEKCLEY